MKILFVMLHAGYVRNYESTIRLLAQRGHHVHVAYERYRNKLGEKVQIERLGQEFSSITFGDLPEREENSWTNFATVIRTLQDYLRYLDPRYANSAALRARVERNMPPGFARALRIAAALSASATGWMLRTLERALPLSDVVGDYLREQQPDVLLITPLVDFGSNQVDYVKSSAALGIPSALCVASWDNLTNKGVMRVVPDRIFVWNEMQREEAVDLHGARADSVVVTGAQVFDQWFEWKPSRTREEFARTVGLPADQPIVLYLGSSFFIAPDEAQFGEKWIRALRNSGDPVLSSAGILIRPHPTNIQQWLAFDFSPLGHVSVWPRLGAEPFSEQFKIDFFDSLYYSSAVVGVNTSAMIEAGIVGRAVCAIRAPEFAHSQDGTLHFQHLVKVNGGLLHVSANLNEHLIQLRSTIADADTAASKSRRFIEAFVRPHGLDAPATPILADAIEKTAGLPVRRRWYTPIWAPFASLGLLPLARLTRFLWRAERKLRKDDGLPWWVPPVRLTIGIVMGIACTSARVKVRATEWWLDIGVGMRRLLRQARRRVRNAMVVVWRMVYWFTTRRVPKAWKRLRQRVARLVHWVAQVPRVVSPLRRKTAKMWRRGSAQGGTMAREVTTGTVQGVGRRIRDLFFPSYRRDRKFQLDSLQMIREHTAVLKRLEKQASNHEKKFETLIERQGKVEKSIRLVGGAFDAVQKSLEQQSSLTADLTASAQLMSRHKVEDRQVRWHLRRTADSSQPIVVGPWTGEIGFEVLYWIPFVRWAKTSFGLDSARMVAVSRGGAASWYQGIAGRYLDVFDFASRDELRASTEKFRKQAVVTPLDKELIRRVSESLGVGHVKLLHPSLMFRLFTPVWRKGETIDLVQAFTRYEGFTPAAESPILQSLPKDYVAVKWYFSTSFPDTPENREFATRVVRTLSQKSTVVLLKTGLDLDDHLDYECGGTSNRIRTIEPDVTATNNLELQTSVIAGARAFVGTYGGFSYLAPLLGVNAIAFYSNHLGFRSCHLELAQRVFTGLQRGAFFPINTKDIALLDLLAENWDRASAVDMRA